MKNIIPHALEAQFKCSYLFMRENLSHIYI